VRLSPTSTKLKQTESKLMVIALLLALPFIALGMAAVRAVVLFFPTMLALGAVHSYIPMVPPLGWAATFWVVFALSLLIPTTSGSIDD
jgi:hypothetical protein